MNGVIGTSAQRSGGPARITGAYRYLGDLRPQNVLHAKLVTVDCARARIRSIDATAARAVPGVAVVMTAADLPQPVPRFGPQYIDRPVLATGETKYHGDPVAVVAAETLEAAQEAARLVRVDYEELPAVYTVAGALAPGAPLVQDPAVRPGDPLSGTNVLHEHRYGWGDIDAARSDLVVAGSYTFPMVTHFAIEPHGFIAAPDGDGITVWSTIQHPYWLQRTIAELLGLPLAKVQILAPDPGGGFGGKQHAKYEPLVAFLALRAHRAVRLILTLEETFQAARRNSAEVRVRTDSARTALSPSARSTRTTCSARTPTSPTGSSARAATYPVARTASRRPGSWPAACSPTRRRRPPSAASEPPGAVGDRIEPGRGGPGARDRPP